jgi:SAM-dependent methyltransferase
MDAPAEWWRGFFDLTYAQIGFRDRFPDEVARTADFLTRRLALEPGSRLFDQCSGTGRISLPLARRGIEVIGVDQSAPYVEAARRAAAAEGLRCRYEVGDAFEFVAPEPADAAINWFTSFGYAQDDRRNALMLSNVWASLRPGGRFAIDMASAPRCLGTYSRAGVERVPLDSGEFMLVEERAIDFARGMVNLTWTFLHPGGRREERRLSCRLLMPHELVRMLHDTGFEGVELLGSIDGEPFNHGSGRLIALARRPG